MKKNKLFAIGIPTLNRADLLNETLEKYVGDFRNTVILVLDNGGQEIFQHKNILHIEPRENLGVARSWNVLSRMVFDELDIPNIWMMNDDIYSGRGEYDMMDFIGIATDEYEDDFMASTGSWNNFILPRRTYQEVGPFDEKFWPAYYEDNDYSWRLKLKKKKCMNTAFLYPEIFRESKTLEKCPELKSYIPGNLGYYKSKWGGPPGEERFRIPFDGKNQ